MWQKDRTAESAGRLENLKELVRSMEEFPDLGGFLEHVSPGHGDDRQRRDGTRLDHDPAWRQGPGVRHRVPARLGGRPVPQPARAGRERQAGLEEERRLAYVGITRARRRAKIMFAVQPPHSRPVELDHSLALRRRTARSARGGHGSAGPVWRLWRQPLRPHGALRLDLQHPRLAARAGAHEAGRRCGRKRPRRRLWRQLRRRRVWWRSQRRP